MSLRVSVIIPVYNGEKFIARAIESVLKQTLPAFEIIVINDGSKDGTEKILEQYAGKIIYKTIANGGVSNARNVGIALSLGDWVAFLDADDEWMVDKLQRQTTLISNHPYAGMVFSAYDLWDGSIKVCFSEIHPIGNKIIQRQKDIVDDCFYLLFVENFIKTSTVMINRHVLQKTGLFDNALRTVEDRDLFIRVASLVPVFFIKEPLVRKWHLSDSLGQENIGVVNDRERVQWLNQMRYHDRITKSGMSPLVAEAISSTKKARVTISRRSGDYILMLLSAIDYLVFKMFHLNTKIFVK